MRAAVVERVGEAPVIREVPEPRAGAGEALVEVRAAPVNPIDLSIAAGRFYAGPPEVPYVAGREGLGRVLESDRLPAGARVYFSAPARRGRSGAMAERAAIAEEELVEVPEGAADALAACFGIAGLAAWLPLEWRGRVQEGETVLVLGASGAVGAIAVQAAKLLGAGRVVAAARDRAALDRARELGADATVELEPAGDDLPAAFREAAGGEIDLVIDPLWGPPAVAALEALAEGGRLVQLGQSAAPEAAVPSGPVRGRLLSILGHTNFAAPREVRASAYRRMVEHAAGGRLTVDHDVLPLEQVADAWRRQAEFPRRKLVLRPEAAAASP